MREPWWRAQTQHWYVELNGRQRRVSRRKDPDGGKRKRPPREVEEEWHRLAREGAPKDMRVGDLFDKFIASLTGEENIGCSRRQLRKFERFVGREKPVSKLIPNDLTEYLKTKPGWRPSSVRTCVNRLHAALNWGVREGLVGTNPISSTPGYKRQGRYERRKGVISDADRRTAEEAAAPEFRSFPVGLRETGARLSELERALVEKVSLEGAYMLVPNKTAGRTGQAERKIYLSSAMRELLRGVIGGRTSGHVFLNSRGRPWNCHSVKKRWEALRRRTGVKGTLYQFRHGFATTAINERNVNPVLVAQLMGHTDLHMLLRHYAQEDPEALKRALEEITRKEEE